MRFWSGAAPPRAPRARGDARCQAGKATSSESRFPVTISPAGSCLTRSLPNHSSLSLIERARAATRGSRAAARRLRPRLEALNADILAVSHDGTALEDHELRVRPLQRRLRPRLEALRARDRQAAQQPPAAAHRPSVSSVGSGPQASPPVPRGQPPRKSHWRRVDGVRDGELPVVVRVRGGRAARYGAGAEEVFEDTHAS